MARRNERKKENRSSKLDAMPITTVVGNDILFKGDINGEGIVRVDGRAEGNITAKQGIILGEKADVEGCLESDNIIIFGHLKGSIKSKELILKSTASIHGDITTDFLEVEIGCKYNGHIKSGQTEHNKQTGKDVHQTPHKQSHSTIEEKKPKE